MELIDADQPHGGWRGTNPFYLIIVLPDQNVGIDLDEAGWATAYAAYMRAAPAQWVLVDKAEHRQRLAVIVKPGDQPYYTARHVGIAVGLGGGSQLTAYGIGAKRVDGCVERLWYLPDGCVCTGDDVDDIGIVMLKGGR
jgi:hypothetical protein